MMTLQDINDKFKEVEFKLNFIVDGMVCLVGDIGYDSDKVYLFIDSSNIDNKYIIFKVHDATYNICDVNVRCVYFKYEKHDIEPVKIYSR